MKRYIFRNYTVEYLFGKAYEYSGYTFTGVNGSEYDSFTWMYFFPIKPTVNQVINEIDDYILQFGIARESIPPSKPLFLFLMDIPFSQGASVSEDLAVREKVDAYNRELIRCSKESKLTYIINFPDFSRRMSSENLIDLKYYYNGQLYINPKLKKQFNEWLELQLSSINFQRKKCLVLDFDNTLWGGVLGEDGVFGIKIGNDYPGTVFHDFQRKILELSESGVILAACSKNNFTDVKELWAQNANVLLVEKSFSSIRINWQHKHQNIVEIAEELNIGLDSIVFIDDNPVERDLVRLQLPMVTVPEFPSNIWELNVFFTDVVNRYFKAYSVTSTDVEKQKQYETNLERKKMLSSASSFDEYVASLSTVLTIEHLHDGNLSRISQMTQKTNQFNLTTIRYSESEILQLKGSRLFFTLSCADKFGDSGITGVAIVALNGNTADIDTLLLSCRILGRKIEYYFLKFILNYLLEKGVKEVIGTYIPTPKNGQVSDFYLKCGFTEISRVENMVKYAIMLNEKLPMDTNIKLIYNG
jgi:FkbH-like protein